MRHRKRARMKPKVSGNSVEYIVGEDDDMDSSSSKMEDKRRKWSKPAGLCRDDPESDSGSSSTDDSSDSSYSLQPKQTPIIPNKNKNSICETCGRGPFRSLKLHLLHCSGVRLEYQCFLCKEFFMTEKSLNEHYMSLYSCNICGQVFSHESMYNQHRCPKKSKPPLALFCAETMPQVCNICKSFFTSETTLQNHVNRVHMSVVRTKVCVLLKPSPVTDKKVIPAAAQSATLNAFNQVVNGKLYDGQASASSQSPPSFHPGPPLALSDTGQSLPLAALQPDTAPSTAASGPVSPQSPTILAMFENDSKDVALLKRMNTGWRSKAPLTCRQCGAISRQPSLVITHRYLHQGRRLHRCQCGRAFKHRLHLLRHCVQHAESMSYICVGCGETFIGATVLARHIKGKSRKKSGSGCTGKRKVKVKCRMPFKCDCGQMFFRPSAFIWHQLQNRMKTKSLKKCLK